MPPSRRPSLIAHRGLPRDHRENTLPGFLAASAAGAEGWELDVHLTRDGVVVVHHDAILPGFAGADAGRRIVDLTWPELQHVPIGPAGDCMPTLDTVLGSAPPATTVYVEVKAGGMVPALLECLQRHPGVPSAVHCFDHRIPLQVRGIDASLSVGILVDSYLVDSAHALRAAGARDFWPHRSMVDAALVTAIHAAGGRVIVWTVNDPDEARQLAAIGVDGLCTDVIGTLRDALVN